MNWELQNEINKIKPIDRKWYEVCRNHWDSLTKPLNSLGLLENMISQIGAIEEREDVVIAQKACVVMCADNGVIEEGVTQCDNSITALVTEHLGQGIANVNIMGQFSNVEVIPVNIGVVCPVHDSKVLDRKIINGTRNFTKGPAMTEDECERAVLVGIETVRDLVNRETGVDIIALGEMGIGNTTTSSAIASVILGCDPVEMTGPGAGLSTDGIRRKIDAIKRGIALNNPDPEDAMDILAKVGGLDIAGLVGVILGGGIYHVPIVLDGFISYAAALCAIKLVPEVKDYLLASHVSSEPASQRIIKELGLNPIINAEMSLGEGTGAVSVFPLLEMALAIYNMNLTFEDSGMTAYEHLK